MKPYVGLTGLSAIVIGVFLGSAATWGKQGARRRPERIEMHYGTLDCGRDSACRLIENAGRFAQKTYTLQPETTRGLSAYDGLFVKLTGLGQRDQTIAVTGVSLAKPYSMGPVQSSGEDSE